MGAIGRDVQTGGRELLIVRRLLCALLSAVAWIECPYARGVKDTAAAPERVTPLRTCARSSRSTSSSVVRGLIVHSRSTDRPCSTVVRRQPRSRRARSRVADARLARVVAPRSAKVTMPSCAGVTISNPAVARSSASACSASAMPRSIAPRIALSPKTWIVSHSFSAREPARQLQAAVAEVDLGAIARRRAGTPASCGTRGRARPAGAPAGSRRRTGLEQPLVRVEHQRVGALDAGEQRAGRARTARPARRRRRRRGTTGPARRTGRRARRSGSTEPVFVVPALATRSPAAGPPRGRPRRPPRTASAGSRIASSVASIRTSPAEAEHAQRAADRRVRLVGAGRRRPGRPPSAGASPRAR